VVHVVSLLEADPLALERVTDGHHGHVPANAPAGRDLTSLPLLGVLDGAEPARIRALGRPVP
jgi:hypothetical protein